MKKIIALIVVFTGLFFTASCENDLDQDNPNKLTTEQYWKSENDAHAGVNSIYAMFYKDGLWARWIYFRLDLTSDEGYSNSPWVELADWTRFNYINYNFWEGNVVTWRDTYKAIFRCNQVIAYVPEIPFQNEDDKKKVIAQAKFLRALHYYYAAILWENIPVVLAPSKPTDTPAQQNVTEVYAQIEKDLNEAFADLPASWTGDNLGRPDKGAAKAFLAKLYMQQRKWTEAKGALDYLVTGSGAKYSLTANYRDNFTDANENNSESVFEIQFGDQRKGDTGEGQSAAVSSNRAQFFAPRSIGWSDGQARYWLVDAFKQEKNKAGNVDTRLRYTLFYPGLEADFGDKTYGKNWEWNNDEAWFRKGSRDYYRNNEDYYSQVNYRLVRYADILLRYAEVLNELGNTADAYQYVDLVRARVNLNTLAVAHPEIGNDHDKFLERLKMERVLELAGESLRWEDLKRWGDLDSQASVDKIALRDPDFKNFVVGKNHRLPIPQSEVKNNPFLEQHPEY
ncbi:RagB/SusD family nutrient uptake outer membrane protein [Flavobacterium sp. HTF]|uniref:RagB/SusD family nutrient uptake outer membrane protein n=1 Tax=Flavobacterium sp. HTF TaxID=2170732 RepID=UPI000D5D5773|nr:RagB/SusD family nutrient uptake outer membrane protein [Flavobacterium sp. HTF]PWB27939.1 RagB/SusD family nutrient uptake outer membrane protein [Flavobacterium sp. HTF]